jgi:hypothetical protein
MAMDLITTNTSSGAATSDFTTGIDSTYKLYIFKFYDVNPATDNVHFYVEFSTDNTTWGMTKTSTMFIAHHEEDDGAASLAYNGYYDHANTTTPVFMSGFNGNGADECTAGELHLFSPASTTYVKHFYGCSNSSQAADDTHNWYPAGYINDAANDVTGVRFTMSSGNFDGTIKMYGVG